MNAIGLVPVYTSVYCLMLAAALAMSSLQDNALAQITSLLFWATVYAVSLSFGYRHSRKPNPNSEQIMNGVAAIGMAAFLLTLMNSNIRVALASLLMWLLAAKNVTLYQRRDLYFAFTITFILMLYSAATSTSTAFLFYMIAYVLAGTLAMVTNFIDERLSLAHAAGSQVDRHRAPLNYTVSVVSVMVILLAASLYLFVPRPAALNFGVFFSGGNVDYDNQTWERQARDSKDMPEQETFPEDDSSTGPDASAGNSDYPSPDTGSGDGTGNGDGSDAGNDNGNGNGTNTERDPDILLADKTGQHSSGGTQQHSRQLSRQKDKFTYAGFQQVLDMNQVGKGGSSSNVLVLYLQANQPLYLRGRVFDTFSNNTWSDSDNRRHKYKLNAEGIELGEQHQPQVQQVITLKQNISNQIFAASKLEKLKFPGNVIARDRYGNIFSPVMLQKGTIYSAQSYLPQVSGRPSTGAIPLDDRQRYLQLPDNLDARFAQLAQQVITGAHIDFDKAVKLETYLRTQFFYTRDTMREPFDMAALNRFLFDTRRGHCELFASAMVLMLRSIGIPARLATGFSATNLNPITGYFEVRGLDAHAWVEVWTEHDGWVTFEPTSFYALPDTQPPATTAQALQQYLKNLSRSAKVTEPGSLSDITLSTVVGALKGLSDMFGVAWDMFKAAMSHLMAWLKSLTVPITIIITLAIAGYFVYQRLKHPILTRLAVLRLMRLGLGNPKQLIIECYTEMEKYFSRIGKPRSQGTTVVDYAGSLVDEFQTLQDPIHDIVQRANQALYSNDTCSKESAITALQGFKSISDHRHSNQTQQTH